MDELEEKIIELSLKLKKRTSELNEVVELNNLIFKKLIHNLKNPVGCCFFIFRNDFGGYSRNYTPEKLEKSLEIIKNSV